MMNMMLALFAAVCVVSPDGRNSIEFATERPAVRVLRDGTVRSDWSPVGLVVDGKQLFRGETRRVQFGDELEIPMAPGGGFALRMTAAAVANELPMPKMIAHRGAGDLKMPEASVEAYSNAVATAVDIVKLDLQYTKDGVVVMGHDGTLKRNMGLDVKIVDWTYDDIKTKGRFVQNGQPTDLSIVRLDEALSIVKGVREFWIDFKAFCPEMAEKVFAAFADAGIDRSRLMVATFNYKALAYLKEHYPEVRRIAHIGIRRTKEQTLFCTIPPGKMTLRTQDEVLEALVTAKEKYGLFGVNMPIGGGATTEKEVAYLQSKGLWVSLWFVQSAAQAAKCRGYGADAYVTDAVSAVRAGLCSGDQFK